MTAPTAAGLPPPDAVAVPLDCDAPLIDSVPRPLAPRGVFVPCRTGPAAPRHSPKEGC
ncbi:hypothetical protein [Zavarzinia sp.]|uniref:hypothetical protein n=1 Tax=Zavarzinia sp. TaxID=2027920 RepID=UPI0035681A51